MKQLLAFLILFVCAPKSFAQDASTRLQEALRLERSAGDYEGAIGIYRDIAADDAADRRVVAQAILQLGKAYESLGRTEAFAAYERVARDFGDQEDIVAEARERMRGLAPSEPSERPAPFERVMVDLNGEDRYFEEWGATLSPSGRFLVGATEYPPGLRYIEVESGEVTDIPLDPDGYGEFVVFSPDETQAAVGWTRSDDRPWPGRLSDAVVVDLATGEPSVAFDIGRYYLERDGITLTQGRTYVLDWSRNGKLLVLTEATSVRNAGSCCTEGWMRELILVSMDSSPPKVLASRKNGTAVFATKGCMDGTGQFAFVEGDLAGEGKGIIRIDAETGQAILWRDKSDVNLWACTWNPGSIVYSESSMGNTVLKVSAPMDDDPSDDRHLTSVPPTGYAVLGGKNGDLAVWPKAWAANLHVLEINPELGTVEREVAKISDSVVYVGPWSPSGNQLVYDPQMNGSPPELHVWEADTGESRAYPIPRRRLIASWESETELAFDMQIPDPDTTWSQTWDEHRLDLESGEISLRRSAELANSLGVRTRPNMPSDVAVDFKRRCLVRLYEEQLEYDIFCAGEDDLRRFRALPSPDNEAFLTIARNDDRSWFGVVAADGEGYREVWAYGDELRLRNIGWGRPGEVFVGSMGDGWMLKSIIRLDTATGETTEVFSSVFDQLEVRRFSVSPDGRRMAVAGTPRGINDLIEATVIRNVLSLER